MSKMYVIAILACVFAVTSAKLECTHDKPQVPTEWVDMVDPCVQAMRGQIQKEINAAMTYMAMGAHFSRDTINRPGFAKMFFDSASEEREHGIKLISYLLMRGELNSDVNNLIASEPSTLAWSNAVEAMKDALKLEATVTKSIRDVIAKCEDSEGYNDYHLVDYLTGEFLEEQYKGQRDLAGKISTLDKMMAKHGALGEFLYDKRLLE